MLSVKDADIINGFDVDIRTVERVRRRLVEEGLETALNGRKQSRYKSPKLDGEQEAQLIALACSEPPAGYARWTLVSITPARTNSTPSRRNG
jgi:hypothetical protein